MMLQTGCSTVIARGGAMSFAVDDGVLESPAKDFADLLVGDLRDAGYAASVSNGVQRTIYVQGPCVNATIFVTVSESDILATYRVSPNQTQSSRKESREAIDIIRMITSRWNTCIKAPARPKI